MLKAPDTAGNPYFNRVEPSTAFAALTRANPLVPDLSEGLRQRVLAIRCSCGLLSIDYDMKNDRYEVVCRACLLLGPPDCTLGSGLTQGPFSLHCTFEPPKHPQLLYLQLG